MAVVVILGLLAAIAIPVYLNQRSRGHDAQASAVGPVWNYQGATTTGRALAIVAVER